MTISAGLLPGPAPVGPGRLVGRYELLYEIATGGMATVYLARARGAANFERAVAIKVCHPHLRKDEDFASMFLDEARLSARIHHPNVVGALEVGDDELMYLVMEFIEGDKLSGLIRAASKKQQQVPVAIAVRMMIDTLEGMHAAHELKDAQGNALNIVHRDISPQNILVGVDGVTRITDFGIAKAEARMTQTREGQIKGKMSYMAPEQLASSNVTRRADIYAAGVVLWETLTGRRLFRAETDAETLNMVLHGHVVKPSDMVPGIPPELDAVAQKALERDPEKRFATAAEFASSLEEAGFKIATTRAVAAYVYEMLGPAIEERRALLRRIDEGGPVPLPDRPDISHSAVRLSPQATPTHGSVAGLNVARRIAQETVPARPPPNAPEEDNRSQKTLMGVLLGVAFVALLGLGSLAVKHYQQGNGPVARNEPRRPTMIPTVNVVPVVAPSIPEGAANPAAEPPVAAPEATPTPEVQPPSQPTAQPAESPTNVRGEHPRHLPRPRGNTPAAPANPSAPSTPLPPAQPGHETGGEYRPSAI